MITISAALLLGTVVVVWMGRFSENNMLISKFSDHVSYIRAAESNIDDEREDEKLSHYDDASSHSSGNKARNNF